VSPSDPLTIPLFQSLAYSPLCLITNSPLLQQRRSLFPDMPPADPDAEHDATPQLFDTPAPPSSDAPVQYAPMASLPAADAPLEPPHLSPRSLSTSAMVAGMTPSSTPLGTLNAARRPLPTPTFSKRGSGLNVSSDIQARMKAFHLGRQGMPPPARTPASATPTMNSDNSTPIQIPSGPIGGGALAPGSPVTLPSPGGLPGGIPAGFKLPTGPPTLKNLHSAPAVPGLRSGPGAKKPSLAEKRGMALPGGLPGSPANGAPTPTGRKKPGLTLSQITGDKPDSHTETKPTGGTMMDKYSDYLDTKTGSLRFKGKAILNSQGVEFSSGTSFSISLDEVDTLDELGKGNYGTVYKVRHSRPKMRRPGQGLAGNKIQSSPQTAQSPITNSTEDVESSPTCAQSASGTTGVIMAMKEIRLELDDAKFAAIIMELDILHRCLSPFIVDFYGAFFQEGAVYICMEFMNGGSIDKLYGDGIPENVLRKITLSTTMGLKSLKDDHNIIHRDVKPTNILMNTRGQIKICDFGVSGNLVASFAKTNIGCQSYMAPERISTGSMGMTGANPGGGTYSVQSDIWSLGLTIIECAMGRYPYPPETYNNIFSQLSVSALDLFV
jgi:mitogen-activated protein kinase kinase